MTKFMLSEFAHRLLVDAWEHNAPIVIHDKGQDHDFAFVLGHKPFFEEHDSGPCWTSLDAVKELQSLRYIEETSPVRYDLAEEGKQRATELSQEG